MVQLITIAAMMKQQRWICQKNKKPINPKSGETCNSGAAYQQIPEEEKRITFCVTYEQAQDVYKKWGCTGLGYVCGLGTLGTYVWAIDLDKCFDKDGNLYPRAKQIVEKFNSYTEYSVSGNGLHIIGIGETGTYPLIKDFATRATEPVAGKRYANVPADKDSEDLIEHIEIYADGHYMTFTGKVYGEEKPLRNIEQPTVWLANTLEKRKHRLQQEELERRTAERAAQKEAKAKAKAEARAKAQNITTSDSTTDSTTTVPTHFILQKMAKWKDASGKKDPKINAVLRSKEAIPEGFPSGSEADAFLLFKLAAFTHNAAQIRSIMLSTPRAEARAEKWAQGPYNGLDWLDNEIRKAIEAVPIKYKPKKRIKHGTSVVVQQRKAIPRVPEAKLLARLNGGIDSATDEECKQHALWVKAQIAPLVNQQCKRLKAALEEFDVKPYDALKEGEVEELKAIADALKDKDPTGWVRAENRYRIAKKYKSFATDKRWITRLLFRWLNVEIKQVLQLDKANGTSYYRDIVLPEIKRCVGGKEGVTAYGIQQKNSYPERQQHCLVSEPVHALTNPKNDKYRLLKRSSGVDFKTPKYPDLVLTMGMPEDAKLTMYDKAVADALYSIAKWNNTVYIPLVLLCQVVKGSKNARITEYDKEQARLSLRKLNSVWVHYREGNRYIEGSFINTIVYGETVNGEEDIATVYLNGIQLGYTYSASKLNHVIIYGTYYREVPNLKLTIENALIIQYMLNRVLLQRRMSRQVLQDGDHGIYSREYFKTATLKLQIYYSTIFEQTGVTLNDSNKTRRAEKQEAIITNVVPEILDYWKQIGVIAGYEELGVDDGQAGVEIEVNYVTHK